MTYFAIKSGHLQSVLMLALVGAGISVSIATAQQGSNPAISGSAVVEIDPAILAERVRGEITRIGSAGTIEDFEASILFAVSQDNYATESIRTALTTVLAENIPDNAKQAIKNILLQLARRKFNRGTGALGAGGDGFSSSFSVPPVIGGGGGGTTYSF